MTLVKALGDRWKEARRSQLPGPSGGPHTLVWPTAPGQTRTPRRRVTVAAPGPHTTPAAGPEASSAGRRRAQLGAKGD